MASPRILATTLGLVGVLAQGGFGSQIPSSVVTSGSVAAQRPASSEATPPASLPPDALSCPELAVALRGVVANDSRQRDWAQLNRYREANHTVQGVDVVFLGDSITDLWVQPRFGEFFPGRRYVGRGIAGQTTPQMLVRMRADVLALKPKAVIILAGVNDIASATGPLTDGEIEGNLESMAQLATASGVKVILSSILPTSHYHQLNPNATPKTTLHPLARIRSINAWTQQYAREHRHPYVDYYSAMVDDQGMLRAELSTDDVHPNAAGYAIMAPLAQAGIDKALR